MEQLDDFEDAIEYRADHLELDELESITAETPFYKNVVKKLMSRGSKVIIGPRGVGKTHHMRIAYKKCLHDKSKPFPIYVSFSKYLRLEPLKNKSSIAIQFFHCWILCKILIATKESTELTNDLETTSISSNSEITWDKISLFCEQIEKQQQRDWHEEILEEISVNTVTDIIEEALLINERKHAILLCDDAALVLTQDYMVEFFDVFRSLKSSKISPKASVYPNTEFGPRFHLGHDAEEVPCWPSILDENYEDLFENIYTKRFDTDLKESIKKCFMYASFGVPRAFINLVNNFNSSTYKTDQQRVNSVIEDQAQLIFDEYLSQADKQPQFKNYVFAGQSILESIIKELSLENKKMLNAGKIQLIIGLKQDKTKNKTNKDIDLIIRLLEETGLIQKINSVKHGQDRTYERFIPHFNLLLSAGAFQLGRGGYISNFEEFIGFPKEKHPFRKNSLSDFDKNKLLGNISLDLPNCASCKQPRSDENQRFCMFCGAELINKSTFESLIEKTIDSLPITKWLKAKIKKDTEITTIGDIVLDKNPAKKLREVKGIGVKKASKVINHAEDWMNEYLS